MAIGDSIQAGLLKADFSPIERSGQSIGQGYKSLGQNLFMGSGGGTGGGTRSSRSGGSSPSGIGGAIERFSENKKKGEQAEMELLGLIETMSPSRLEDLDSGKSRFSKAYKRFIDGELTPNQTEALFGGLVLSEKRNNEVEEKQKLVDFSNFIMSGTEMDPEVVEDFNQAQPGLSALSGDPDARNQFLEYQRDNAPKTGPLGGELGSSDFARFAKEQGIDPVLAGSRFMNLQKAEAEAELANQPKAMTPKEELDYIVKLNQELRNQAEEERKASEFREENKPLPPADPVYKEAAINAIDSAIEKSKGFFATGITGQALQGFAGTDARDLAQAISTVEAAVGFDRLQEMRDSSKTGGALGAINTKELELLSNSLGSLDPLQKPETLRKNLESIKEKYVKILKSVEAEKYAFENDITFKTPKEAMDFVNNFNPSSPQQTANTIDPADIQSEIDRKKQMIRDRDLQNKYFDNPNIQNLGNVNQGN